MSAVASESEDWLASHFEDSAFDHSDADESSGHIDNEILRIISKEAEKLDLEWSPPAEPERSRQVEWFLQPRRRNKGNEAHKGPPHSSWRCTTRLPRCGTTCIQLLSTSLVRYFSLLWMVPIYGGTPRTEDTVAAHLCPSTSLKVKLSVVHPNKPYRTITSVVGKAYTAPGQAASALHSMSVLQVFQAKMLKHLEKNVPNLEIFRELRNSTDLALRATKMTGQSIGCTMGSLVVLNRHLWLTLMDVKDT